MRPDAPVDPLRTARAVLARLRGRAQDCVVSVVSVESRSERGLSTLTTLTTHPPLVADERIEPVNDPSSDVNPGVLMTLGMRHDYPRLPLKRGVSVAEGERAWRTFTRSADSISLGLAADAARAAWSDDPMIRDLMCLKTVQPDAGENAHNTPAGNNDRSARRS